MEACTAVEREIDKVLSKFGGINDHAKRCLQDLTCHIENLKEEIGTCPENQVLTAGQVLIMKQAMNKVKESVQRLAADHRDLHSTVSKVGKAIDRNFVQDFASTSREDVFSGPDKIMLLNQVICQHFIRQGMLDIVDELVAEAGVKTEPSVKEPFSALNSILDSLKQKDLTQAFDWAREHRESLEAQNSSLEFKLHQLQFISLLQKGTTGQNEAIAYARTHFSQFVGRHEKALPALLNIRQVMQQKQVTGMWSGKDELPIEIELGQEHKYHSVFACPILRQQSSESNPPMRLICGHVISRDALTKLGSVNKLKCPYCPVEQNPSEARLIYF